MTTIRPRRPRATRRSTPLWGAALLMVLAACEVEPGDPGTAPEQEEPGERPGSDPPELVRLEEAATATDHAEFEDEGIERWQEEVPAAQDVRIASSVDDYEQPAMWLPPGTEEPAPLLVVLHSWLTGYQQHQSIPFVLLAEQLGWAAIAPDFRGIFDRPEAAGSDLAAQDVLDAIDWAASEAAIDEDRVFVTGFSGGGMMTLLMAGRHPERFAGAAAWVPVYDLIDFYEYNLEHRPEGPYPQHIETICGGDPTVDADAREDCARRSPSAHLDAVADHGLPVYLGHGLADDIVRPDVTLRAYNQAADPDEPIEGPVIDAAREGRLPEELMGSVQGELYFDEEDPEVFFGRRDGPDGVVIFDGEHDLVYHPTMRWLAALAAGDGST